MGAPEERACFAELGIQTHGIWLTEGNDTVANRLRQAPLLSAYHFAEWLAWNWWRLRWEPRSNAEDWAYAHRMATIGHGYIWPNLTISSDGQRTTLVAKPTHERPRTPFRYIADHAAAFPVLEFETEVDFFIDQVIERLDWARVEGSNLEQVWSGVIEERNNPKLRTARKLEALLGQDPDESDSTILAELERDAKQLSTSGVEELAAEHGQSGQLLNADKLRTIADKSGYDASPNDAVRLQPSAGLPRMGEVPAWRLGAQAAKALRDQENLDGEFLSNERLAQLAGVQSGILDDRTGAQGISFALKRSGERQRVVLRSKWRDGRRFELARLMGDRIAIPQDERLRPATRAYTYRQKMQRSFAAEFLCPFDAVDAMLGGDYSVESQKDVAEYFGVSELTIRTLLVNHGRLDRDDLEGEPETLVA
jgi:hypothetical protein